MLLICDKKMFSTSILITKFTWDVCVTLFMIATTIYNGILLQ